MAVRLGSRYELDEVLGRGGSGEVWRGTSPDGDVAIKVLRPELSTDPDIVERFVGERSLLLGVQSPNIVAVRDLVIEGDRLAIVMDLVSGGDLRSRLRAERTLQPLTAVNLMIQVLEGIATVHSAGIVHRDLKPENLLLDAADDSSIRVADFGIARLSSSTRATRTTGLLGTPRYVAPELSIRGRVTPAVDVYAAGVTLYEMLFGRVPFDGPHPAAVLRAHAEDEPYRPDGVPDSLWAALDSMLAKNPEQRPTAARAAEMLRSLRSDVVTLSSFPALARSGGPDTDETYTTDPHGNATDLTGIGRRGRAHTNNTGTGPTPPRRRRWLVPVVAGVVVVAVVAALLTTAGGGTSKVAAPPYAHPGAAPADARVQHEWRFATDRGDRLDGVMQVTPDGAAGFGAGTSVVSVFPNSVTDLHFTPAPTHRLNIAATTVGKAAHGTEVAVQFALPRLGHDFTVRYTANMTAAGTSPARFDDLGWAMDNAFAKVCYAKDAPPICPVRDRPTRIAFLQTSAGPIGADQTIDLRPLLVASTSSGETLTGEKLTGVRWIVDPGSTARINRKGVLTGIAPGTVQVTARLGDLKTESTLSVTVQAQKVPEIVSLSIVGDASIKSGAPYRAVATYDNGSNSPVPVTWSVSPPGDATIDSNGFLVPVRSDRTVHVRAEVLSASGRTVSSTKDVHIAKVDVKADTDNDGVTDLQDACPTTPGLAKFAGCPDADNDGVPEPPDACPTQPGVAPSGCPTGVVDTDHDGVADPTDACRTTPGLTQFNGCPDADHDGVPEPPDQCPGVAGVAPSGCPAALDQDKDGIPDAVDECRTTPGPASIPQDSRFYRSLNGCPLPDLVLTDVAPDNPNPVAGDCVTFHATIVNQGGPIPTGPPIHLGVLFVIDPSTRKDHVWYQDNTGPAVVQGAPLPVTTNKGSQGSCGGTGAWSAVTGDHTITAEVNDRTNDGTHLQIRETSPGLSNNVTPLAPLHVG